ncbi:alpha/beta hydrolase [Leptolyngbya ohadii]|uniref:alpha/beta hydrolase n=1 Tax=Leptolyngbya ohadii TaxID=1962290 RepID=UPI000B59889F|nr:alpha/beta hydrolase [Leptolyngbya ohadii]
MKALARFGIVSLIALSATGTLISYHVQAQESPQAMQTQSITVSANSSAPLQPGINRVTFQSEGETLVGNLYLPATYQAGDRLPTVIVTGAWMTIKEQMPALYAQKLADQGFAAFAFDFRTFGESSGALRNFESPAAKITDIKNAVSFLQTMDAVDGDRIAGLGICASAGYMASATAQDSRIKALVTVAPWLHNPEIVNTVYGGEAAVQQRIEKGRSAKAQFLQTGEVISVPATSRTDSNSPMFGEVDYYQNPQRGAIPQWENHFAIASWAEWLTFDPTPQAQNIQVPTLFIHSEAAAIPEGARQFFAAIPGENKQFVWLENRTQFDFYDQEQTVNEAIDLTVNKLRTILETES